MSLWEYLGWGSSQTKLLLHLNGSSADSSGNGNNWVWSGTEAYSLANGKFWQGASFNGSSKIVVAQGTIGTGTFTYCFWLNSPGRAAGDNNHVFSYSVSKPASDAFAGRIITNDSGDSSGKFRVFARGATNENIYIDTNSRVDDGTWKNIVVILNVGAGTITIYVNGVLDQGEQTGATISSIDTTGSFTLGKYDDDATGSYIGNLDEVIIENVARSTEKVKRYYTYTKWRFWIL